MGLWRSPLKTTYTRTNGAHSHLRDVDAYFRQAVFPQGRALESPAGQIESMFDGIATSNFEEDMKLAASLPALVAENATLQAVQSA